MIAREQAALMRNYGRYPVEFVRGEGAWLFDPEGRGYLDLMSGISMINTGHCHPDVVAAIREQAGTLINTSNLYYTEPMVELAEWIRDTSMGGRVFFCNSGAEAAEAAIKLARKHGGPDRNEFVSLEDSFHGRTMGALALTGQPGKQEAFKPLMPGARYVPRNDKDALRAAVGEKTCAIAIEIAIGARPGVEQNREVGRIDETVMVEVGWARIGCGAGKLDDGQMRIARTGVDEIVPLAVGSEQLGVVLNSAGVVRLARIPVGVLGGSSVRPREVALAGNIGEADPDAAIDAEQLAKVRQDEIPLSLA